MALPNPKMNIVFRHTVDSKKCSFHLNQKFVIDFLIKKKFTFAKSKKMISNFLKAFFQTSSGKLGIRTPYHCLNNSK